MLYADDLIAADKEEAEIQTGFTDWQALESKGLKININKTETMVCANSKETLMISDRAGHLFKQTDTIKYLRSVINAKGGCEHDLKNRFKTGWLEWKDLAGVLCDAKMPKI